MARLFGFVGNRADLGAKVLEMESGPLKVLAKGKPLGWGIGFCQSGEVLLRRRPIDDRAEIDIAAVGSDIRADVLIGHVRAATIGNLRTENTHPFRYRQWLFAHTGTIENFTQMRPRFVESIPDFLMRNVRGDTDSELIFHIFLSFLHDAGYLVDGDVDPAASRAALRSTIALVDRLCAEEGVGPVPMNLLTTNGEHMVALHRAASMGYKVIKGRADLERLLGDDTLRKIRIPDMASCHFCMVASDFDVEPRGWTMVKPDSVVTITRTNDPKVEAL